MNIYLNESVKSLFFKASSIACENYNLTFMAPHLLQALLSDDFEVKNIIQNMDKDVGYIYDWADVRIDDCPKSRTLPDEAPEDPQIESVIQHADSVRIDLGLDEVTPICIMISITTPHVIYGAQELKSLPLRGREIISYLLDNLSKNKNDVDLVQDKLFDDDKSNVVTPNIDKYCKNLSALVFSKELNKVVGREKELRMLSEILIRRNKPNALIIGESGVGKTTLVQGLAYEIYNNKVPDNLIGLTLFELDINILGSGSSYKGETEDRLKNIIKESKSLEKVILFIDDIHTILNENSSVGNISNILKSALSEGDLTVIGTTTPEDYRKKIEPENTFNSKFESIVLEEPDEATCERMLNSVLEGYREHHQINVKKEIIPECIRLAKRYSKSRKMPESAIDLIDRTMAAVKMLGDFSREELKDWFESYSALLINGEELSTHDLKDELLWEYRMLKERISPILIGKLKDQIEVDSSLSITKIDNYIKKIYKQLLEMTNDNHDEVGATELAAVMASKTGIPIGKIQAKEKEKLINMEDLLRERVVGQDYALKVLSDAIIENRSGLNKEGQPIGSFFLLGPTGTGKTELAKSMAELLFNDENAMIRFDMSEFKEEHSAALLYGAPPGYVGYEEGGMVVNKIREQPYSVVLFDEIEKAHPSVFDVFLQIMDEGKIHDKLGKEGDFSNALILFTSNIGSQEIANQFNKGEIPDSAQLRQIMANTGRFRPEFLARLTEILPFRPISNEMAELIFSIQLEKLKTSLGKLDNHLEISSKALKHLSSLGYSQEYGARQISGIIRSHITRPLSKSIVKEELKPGQKILIEMKKDKVTFSYK